MIVQSIIASIASGGGATPPVTPEGGFLYNSGGSNWAYTNATVTTYGSYVYPNISSGSLHTLTGTQYMLSGDLGNSLTLNINLWFYPTSNNVMILGELGQPVENSGWHYSMLEIDSSNYLRGRVWEMGDGAFGAPPAVTSTGTVTLNAWNHVYMYYDNATSTFGMSLNNETAVTQGSITTRHTSDTNSTYFGIGLLDSQSMSNGNRYQGKFSDLAIDTTITGSTYSATLAKYTYSNTYTSSNPPAEATNAAWDTSNIVGYHTTWPPGTPGASHGAVLSSGTYVSVPAQLKKGSWTVEIVAELNPQNFWGVVFGNESFNANIGYAAWFGNSGISDFRVGGPAGYNTYDLTGLVPDKAYWAFVNDGSTMSLYRNGILINPTTTGFTQPTTTGPNNIYFAARHNNDGSGFTDTMYMTLYKYIISDTAKNVSSIRASYNSLRTTYDLPPIFIPLTTGTALTFNGTDNRRVIVSDNLADWNLGDNWTIEWWQKIPVGVDGYLSVVCQDANVPTYSGIDVFVNAGSIQMFNGGLTVSEAPATRGQWNHIAIQKDGTTLAAYINGVQQSVGGSHSGTIAPSSPLNVVIGSRTWDGGSNFYGQYFNGQLANIRISNVSRYTYSFNSNDVVDSDAFTVLALDGSAGSGGMLVDETARHTITNNGAVISYKSPDVTGTITVGYNNTFGDRYGYSTGFVSMGSVSATPAAIPLFFTEPTIYTRVQFNGTTIGTTPTDSMMGTATGVTSLSVTVDGITQTLTTGGPSAGGYSIAGDPFGFATKNGQTLSFTINLL